MQLAKNRGKQKDMQCNSATLWLPATLIGVVL